MTSAVMIKCEQTNRGSPPGQSPSPSPHLDITPPSTLTSGSRIHSRFVRIFNTHRSASSHELKPDGEGCRPGNRQWRSSTSPTSVSPSPNPEKPANGWLNPLPQLVSPPLPLLPPPSTYRSQLTVPSRPSRPNNLFRRRFLHLNPRPSRDILVLPPQSCSSFRATPRREGRGRMDGV